jgi:hypothetical protein
MKLIFFLIAFCLVSIRLYFSWTGKDRERRGISESSIVIKSANFTEEINYSGKFQLLDDESGFKTISPGGYFKFRLNDIRVKAESNLRGDIEYGIQNGNTDIPMNEDGKLLVRQAVKEMIYWGYDADARMERVYQRGGIKALLNEVDSVKPDNIKIIYMSRLFTGDSLPHDEMVFVIKKIKSLGSDMDKSRFLNKVSPDQFKNPSIDSVYFEIISGMGSDMEKSNAIHHLLDQDSLNESNISAVLDISRTMGSEMDKAGVYSKLIDRNLIGGSLFDSLLKQISNMGSDMDKSNLFKKMTGLSPISENQWIGLIQSAATLGSDMDKSNLLIEIAPRMPKTDAVKAAFVKSAKSIGNDNDYGRVMRALV